jgi:hypothetical protein
MDGENRIYGKPSSILRDYPDGVGSGNAAKK